MKKTIKEISSRIRLRWKKKSVKGKSLILGVIWLGVIIMLLLNWKMFGREANDDSVKGIVQWFCLWIFGVFGAIGWQFYCLFLRKKTKTARLPITRMLMMALLMGTGMFWVVEWIYNPNMFTIPYQYVAISICVSAVVFLILILLCNSLRLAALICSILYFVWAAASYFTYLFRGLPLQIADLLDVGTAATVAGDYDYEITLHMLIVGVILISILTCMYVGRNYKLARTRAMKIVIRILGIVLLAGGIQYLKTSDQPDDWGVSVDGNRPGDSFYRYGVQLCFIQGARDSIVTEPEGYSVETVEEVRAELEPVENTGGGTSSVKPNIIAIMDETFADLNAAGDFAVSEEVMPFYNSLQENTVKGNVMVSTLGGGTGKTEFEFLTGTSMRLFGSTYSPYVMIGNRLDTSMASTLKEQGYATCAIHPFIATNYNREITYETMGFDTYLSLDDFRGMSTKRNFVTDEACYEKIGELIDEEEDPLFTFCVTIQNHAPYNDQGYEGDITLPEYEDKEAEQYLSLVHESDQALEKLIQNLEQSEEPTMVVFFGDHLPGLSEEFYQYIFGKTNEEMTFEEYQKYYMTPFMIWANYDIPEQDEVVTSMNYLGAMTLQMAGAELTEYEQYLLDLKEKVPGFSGISYYGRDGRFHEYGSGGQEETYLSLDDCINYNKIFGGKSRLDEFFFLKDDE